MITGSKIPIRSGSDRLSEFIAEAWKGIFVSKHTIVVTIAEARRALREYGDWIVHRPNRGYQLAIPSSDDHVRIGWHIAERGTSEGLEKALHWFRLAAQDSVDRRPFDAIARVYLLLGAHSVAPPSDIYTRFKEAHNQAVKLFGLTPELRADRAHAVHLFERNPREAERELLHSAREEASPGTYVRLTLLYAAKQRFDLALQAFQRAQVLDRLEPSLPAAETFLWLSRRDFHRAAQVGEAGLELQPYLFLARAFYAQALEFSGCVGDALTHYRAAQTLAPHVPWLKALEAGCLARNGCCRQAEEILSELQNS